MIFSSLAKKLTTKSTHRQHHHAAVVTCGGAIVAVGYNKGQEHAEMRAIKRIKDRRNLTLYSFRFTKGGKWGMARPCPKCQANLTGVKIFYTDENGNLSRM